MTFLTPIGEWGKYRGIAGDYSSVSQYEGPRVQIFGPDEMNTRIVCREWRVDMDKRLRAGNFLSTRTGQRSCQMEGTAKAVACRRWRMPPGTEGANCWFGSHTQRSWRATIGPEEKSYIFLQKKTRRPFRGKSYLEGISGLAVAPLRLSLIGDPLEPRPRATPIWSC